MTMHHLTSCGLDGQICDHWNIRFGHHFSHRSLIILSIYTSIPKMFKI